MTFDSCHDDPIWVVSPTTWRCEQFSDKYILRYSAQYHSFFRPGDLPKLDLQVDRGEAWKSQWDAYISLSGLDAELASKQVQAPTPEKQWPS